MHFVEMTRRHTNFVEEYCGPFVSQHILSNRQMFIAGGALVSFMDGDQVPRDIDIYVPNQDPSLFARNIERNAGPEYELLSASHSEQYRGSGNYLYLRWHGGGGRGGQTGMQFIFRPLCDPINTLCGFDIELCKIALTRNGLIQGQLFPRDFNERLITLDVITNPLRTLERIKKYRDRGFRPTEGTEEFIRLNEPARTEEGGNPRETRDDSPTARGGDNRLFWDSNQVRR